MEADRSRLVAPAHMPDHDLAAALFVDLHITTGSASIVAPIVTVIAPIVIVAIVAVDSVSVTAVRFNAEDQLSKRDFRFGRDSISGGCWESPHCTRDGGDKRQFSHSNLLLCR
jgi:hypothetical protein